MKHILLFAAVLFSFGSFAQTCTPDANYSGAPAGLYPSGPLGPTCELIAPKTIVSLTDTTMYNATISQNVTLYITRMRINSVSGLPSGLALSTDVMASADANGPWGYWDNTGSVPNQTAAFGCAYVYGTGGDWDAAIGGGPNNDGAYPLVFEVDAYIQSTNPAGIAAFIGAPTWVSAVSPSLGGGAFFIYDTLVVASDYANISTTISGSTNVDPVTQYMYSVPQDPNVTYAWTATNGTIVSGQGTNQVTVEWNGSGNIQVDLTDGGCQGTDNMDVTANPTGLDEVAGISASIYPNPNNGVFTLRIGATDAISVRVMDVSGKIISSKQFNGSALYSFDLQDAPAGVYLMEIETEQGRTFKRLVKN
ncbi:MAG: T9SS type A sorting domain-containing protein [Flavobacteriales bacterium]|nr:T9SS type A sorting domain-containing protein [Flavobacteriales bacterium]